MGVNLHYNKERGGLDGVCAGENENLS